MVTSNKNKRKKERKRREKRGTRVIEQGGFSQGKLIKESGKVRR